LPENTDVPLTISPFDLTSGLKDAVETMSQYLAGHRKNDWFVVGTCKYFEEIGGTRPTKPISEADLIALSAVVERCDRIRNDSTGTTTRGLNKFYVAISQIAPYLQNELGITLDDKVAPTDALTQQVPDLATATSAAHSEYMALKSVPAYAPGSAYVRPPAPNEAYLDQDRDLKPDGNRNLDDIVGAKVDGTSEYWTPPEPTSVAEGTYGRVPDALFK
jgi:hypothetical protein